MAFFAGAYTGIPVKKDPKERSQDLENLLGNYLITDHQLSKLKFRIIDHLKSNQNTSSFMFRSDDEKRWFKVNVVIEEMKNEDDFEQQEESKPEVGMIDDDDIVQ
jgi:hypothetical protein